MHRALKCELLHALPTLSRGRLNQAFLFVVVVVSFFLSFSFFILSVFLLCLSVCLSVCLSLSLFFKRLHMDAVYTD